MVPAEQEGELTCWPVVLEGTVCPSCTACPAWGISMASLWLCPCPLACSVSVLRSGLPGLPVLVRGGDGEDVARKLSAFVLYQWLKGPSAKVFGGSNSLACSQGPLQPHGTCEREILELLQAQCTLESLENKFSLPLCLHICVTFFSAESSACLNKSWAVIDTLFFVKTSSVGIRIY